ncbi:MAG: hypothetical protein IIC67_05395 [Thaumarchaeota archaeon]|nr:hypothetical protein [Nitrososphaerota archaeon]
MEYKKYSVADDIQIAKEDKEKFKQEIVDIGKGLRELIGVKKRFLLSGRKRRKERRSRA